MKFDNAIKSFIAGRYVGVYDKKYSWKYVQIKIENYNNYPDNMVHGPTWDPPGADRTQVGPMWATWTLLSGYNDCHKMQFMN